MTSISDSMCCVGSHVASVQSPFYNPDTQLCETPSFGVAVANDAYYKVSACPSGTECLGYSCHGSTAAVLTDQLCESNLYDQDCTKYITAFSSAIISSASSGVSDALRCSSAASVAANTLSYACGSKPGGGSTARYVITAETQSKKQTVNGLYYARDVSVQRCTPQLLVNYNSLDKSPLIQTLQSTIFAQTQAYLSDLQTREAACLDKAITATSLATTPAACTATTLSDSPSLQARYGKAFNYACRITSTKTALASTAQSAFGIAASGQVCCTGFFASSPSPGSLTCPAVSPILPANYFPPGKAVRYCSAPATTCRVFSCSSTATGGGATTTVYISGCVSDAVAKPGAAGAFGPYSFANEVLASLLEATPAPRPDYAGARLANSSTLIASLPFPSGTSPTCSGAAAAAAGSGRALAWVAAALAVVLAAHR